LSTLFEILLILFLILLNGFFSMAEIALVSSKPFRLQAMADDGSRRAKVALQLIENPNRLLSTVQIGITLIGIISGALGGITLGNKLASVISTVPSLSQFSTELGLALVVIPITYLSLVIGELLPKRISLNNPEQIACFVSYPMQALGWLVRPFIALLSWSTELGLRMLGMSNTSRLPITEEEIRDIIEEGTRTGILEESEQDIVEAVFRFGGRTVDAIMTSRIDIVWIDLEDTYEENLDKVVQSKHSRYPVSLGSLDNIQGILLAKDFLSAALVDDPVDIKPLLRPAFFAPESMSALKAMEEMRQSGVPAALVLDEFGGVLGMVTPTDILESIVGVFQTVGEVSEPAVIHRTDGTWLLDGQLRVDELKEIIDLDDLPEEERIGYQTLGGLIMSCLGAIPVSGQTFEWKDHLFEVVDMDGRRVDKVLVTRLSNPNLSGKMMIPPIEKTL
jgi:putative hemolysin